MRHLSEVVPGKNKRISYAAYCSEDHWVLIVPAIVTLYDCIENTCIKVPHYYGNSNFFCAAFSAVKNVRSRTKFLFILCFLYSQKIQKISFDFTKF